MKIVWWMVAASILSAVAITAWVGAQTGFDVLLGMVGPVVAVLWTRIAVERTYRRYPQGVTNLMIKAFGAKMVFFAAYISLILGARLVRPIPFVISFTLYFLALHISMAFSLRRLMAVTGRPYSA
jgi:hypothetical protein